jgi:transcriptional regulator with XRE-family HTH domain
MSARKNREQLRQVAALQIRDARSITGVSQMKLAQLMQVSQPLVSSWECGRVTPSIDDIIGIETALQLDAGSLLSGIAAALNTPTTLVSADNY